ncbi:ABC transporter ATP-binding protein [uncultured Desulfosarcina sp.]|uniref:ABC transporter ATP-binding protein n=1 Tax=uncultured Desulfosarcina sp. TaxID=218289 RepID=UPI0029C9382A|nr:ABC transporter ATP-binding protein [uncultured Desulfosarcina sp.]
MIDTYRKIRDLLDTRERRNALLLLCLILIMGLLEVLGVASIMPFISVASNPEIIHSNKYLSRIYHLLDFESTDSFLLFIGSCVFLVVIGSISFKAVTHWAMVRYTQMRNYSISCRLLRKYLNRQYSWFIDRHSADLGKSIITEVLQVVNSVLIPGVQLIANGVVGIFLIFLIIAVNPKIASISLILIGGSYIFIYLYVRNILNRIGIERFDSNQERFRVAHEALGGIKDVKILGIENGYLNAFRKPALRFSKAQTKNLIIGELPRFLLEAIVFGGMLILLLALLATEKGKMESVLPLIALYTFAGARLIPALQKVYQALAKIRFGKVALDSLHNDMFNDSKNNQNRINFNKKESIQLKNNIELKNVQFRYPQSEKLALKNFNLTIPANKTIAFVGSSGSGKTTAVDLILGLLSPQEGSLSVDGRIINEKNVRSWQQNIGYVPQNIFLIDDTISGNIAFGIDEKKIDKLAVEIAAKTAGLHDYITTELPNGYNTEIGERGVRLSGGQRQRIGIARALYHDPGVLVLDEATSALDNITEKDVMDAVHNLGSRKTIIIIAHRLTTVQKCDQLFMIENGNIVGKGTYNQLLLQNEYFSTLASSNM